MNVTVSWINEYLDAPLSADALVEALAGAGFPCESREALPGGDERLDIEITSNRGDCVSVVGLAREAAAVTRRGLRLPSIPEGPGGAGAFGVRNEAVELCPLYTGRVIRGVRVGPSPAWLRERVESVGLRSINNVVDVTNFVLFEMGQPLHAFDLSTLRGGIVVRRAEKGETLTVIDGTRCALTPAMLVIADEERAVALAGIMGGAETEVGEATTEVLLEAASFDAACVRAASRALRLSSDACYRFERGVHPATVEAAARRAAALIVEVAGGAADGGATSAGAALPQRRRIALRPEQVRRISGIEIAPERMLEILSALELEPEVEAGGAIGCRVPWHRLDLEREIDLVEEVVRIHGLSHIEARDRIEIRVAAAQPREVNRQAMDRALIGCGYHEMVTFSFTSRAEAKRFSESGVALLEVQDERRQGAPVLQPSLLPGLLGCRKRNQDAGHHGGVRLYERGVCFGLREGAKFEEHRLALIADVEDRQTTYREVRGAVESALRAALGQNARIRIEAASRPWLGEGEGAEVFVGGGSRAIGWVGLLGAKATAAAELQTPVAAAEIVIGEILETKRQAAQATGTAQRPPIVRDLSLVVEEGMAWRRVEEVVAAVAPADLTKAEFAALYRGEPIPKGRKSVTLRLTFRNPDRTLRHEEVDGEVARLVEAFARELSATLRT